MAAVALVVAATATIGAPPVNAQVGIDGGDDKAAVAQRAGEAWLAGAQQADGGFAVGGLDGVETPESVLAHAALAQTADVWSEREAIDGVEALGSVGGGPSVLEALGALAASADSPVESALLITRVALPLGLDPTAFDPARQGRPVDLVALLDGTTADDPVTVQSEVVIARVALGEDAPEPLVTAIVDATLPAAGWPASDEDGLADVVSTASAVVALIAAGIPQADDRVAPGLRVLAEQQHDDGGWGLDGESQPVDTAAAMGALRAAGFDPDDGCWQEELSDGATGRVSPSDHLVATQAENGHWGSEDDALSTASALQALGGRWLPLARAEVQTCGGGVSWPLPTVPPALVVIVGIGAVGTGGSLRILRGHQPAF